MANEGILDPRNAAALRGRHLVQIVTTMIATTGLFFAQPQPSISQDQEWATPDPVARIYNEVLLGQISEGQRQGGGAVAGGSAEVVWVLSTPGSATQRWSRLARRNHPWAPLSLGNEVGIQARPFHQKGPATSLRRETRGFGAGWGLEATAPDTHGLYVLGRFPRTTTESLP